MSPPDPMPAPIEPRPPTPEALYGEFRPRVYRIARGMLGNREDAEDAAHDVLLKAWKALGRFRGEADASTWIHRIAVNHCLKVLRRRRLFRLLREKLARARDVAGPTAPDEPSWLLADLPADWRACVVLKDVEGLSYEEAAAILGVPPGTVMSRVARARERMRAQALRRIREEEAAAGGLTP